MKIIENIDVLKMYTMKYYFKYFPSNKRLENKLLEKTNKNKELVEQTLEYMKDFLEEDKIIESKIKNYIFKKKSIFYIKGKLWEKLFPQNRGEYYLEKLYTLELQKEIVEYHYYKMIEQYPREKVVEKLLNKGFSYDLIRGIGEKG